MSHPQKNEKGQASSSGKAGNEASKDKTDLGTSSIERNDMRGILDISAITKSPLMTTNNGDKNQSGNSTASSVDHNNSNKNLHKSNLINGTMNKLLTEPTLSTLDITPGVPSSAQSYGQGHTLKTAKFKSHVSTIWPSVTPLTNDNHVLQKKITTSSNKQEASIWTIQGFDTTLTGIPLTMTDSYQLRKDGQIQTLTKKTTISETKDVPSTVKPSSLLVFNHKGLSEAHDIAGNKVANGGNLPTPNPAFLEPFHPFQSHQRSSGSCYYLQKKTLYLMVLIAYTFLHMS